MISRSVMLEKIRRACAQADSGQLPEQLPAFPRYSDPVETFREELEQVGGIFLEGRGSKELASALVAVMQQSKSREIYWESEELLHKHGIPFTLRKAEASAGDLILYSSHLRQEIRFPFLLNVKTCRESELAGISLSASSARVGIAETGTIVHEVTAGIGRLFSLLPPAHIVLLSERDLVMNTAELFTSPILERCGSALTLITGPSRTADIEKTLVTGVHGTKQLFVILTS
ncbi:lactate utilization protein [Acidobacteria bacterium AH-259-D05]|nr:lactate utilization protein [Acidobacteria bacterium AH-259-D05]